MFTLRISQKQIHFHFYINYEVNGDLGVEGGNLYVMVSIIYKEEALNLAELARRSKFSFSS
jgi:hypothetical protein